MMILFYLVRGLMYDALLVAAVVTVAVLRHEDPPRFARAVACMPLMLVVAVLDITIERLANLCGASRKPAAPPGEDVACFSPTVVGKFIELRHADLFDRYCAKMRKFVALTDVMHVPGFDSVEEWDRYCETEAERTRAFMRGDTPRQMRAAGLIEYDINERHEP